MFIPSVGCHYYCYGSIGSFEITKPDGTVVFSKLETGRLPTLEDLEMILKKLKE